MNKYNFTSSLFFCFLVMASTAYGSGMACHNKGYMTMINKSHKALTVDYYVNHWGVKHVHAGSFELGEHRERGHRHDLCWQVDVYDKYLNLDRLVFTAGKQKMTCDVGVDAWPDSSGIVYNCTPKNIINIEGKCLDSDQNHRCTLSVK